MPVVTPGVASDAVVVASRIENISPITTTMASIASMTIVLQWRLSPMRAGGFVDPRAMPSLSTGPPESNSVVMGRLALVPEPPTRCRHTSFLKKKIAPLEENLHPPEKLRLRPRNNREQVAIHPVPKP